MAPIRRGHKAAQTVPALKRLGRMKIHKGYEMVTQKYNPPVQGPYNRPQYYSGFKTSYGKQYRPNDHAKRHRLPDGDEKDEEVKGYTRRS